MEGGASAAIEVLVQNLINVSKEEISLIRGLDQEAEQLQTSLEMIQGYLNDAENGYITQESVKAWLNKLEEVAFDADNVLDELNYHALHKKLKATKSMMNKALTCFSSFHHTVRPLHMAHRIKEINTSLDSINKRATDLQLQRILVDAPAAVPDAAFETDCFTIDPIFIGRDDDVPKLVEVMINSPEERMFSILAVVGMGGMGKTTLTRKLFHHQKMKTRFGHHIWVHVSQTFDPFIIFKKMLESIFSSKTSEAESRQAIMKNLEETLKAKTYLLVLDDIWNEDVLKWTDFIDSLSGVTSTKGNGIIITTRSTKVASIVNPLETHLLKGLSEEDCWSIIKAKAFKMGDVIPSEFESIGRKIARRCQGLPLAAKVVGGVLRCKSEEEWLSIQQEWLTDVEGENISRILRLSYDNLSSPALKKCFAYCSIYPKGGRMGKHELIEMWMAEGFLRPDGRNDMESMGDKFVNVLLHNSLLQQVPREYYSEEDEICVMHDLVHDIASSVSSSLKVRYMSHEDESIHIPRKSAKYLRTLFIQGNFLEFKLSDFKCLHVLKFGSHLVTELPSAIGNLIHLRKLNISKTQIEYLPNSIGELLHLQTLRASTRSLMKLPHTVNYLINLRHLYVWDHVKLPPKIGRLTSLQTLPHFIVGKESGYQIQELGNLKNIKGELKILNLENVKGKEEAETANIFHNPNLSDLMFVWSLERGEEINDENVLEGLQPHKNVKKLKIHGFKGKRFPQWTLKMAIPDEPQGCCIVLNKLVEIRISECDKCEEIPTLGHLPNLKNLSLIGLRNVKSLNSSFYGIHDISVWKETINASLCLKCSSYLIWIS